MRVRACRPCWPLAAGCCCCRRRRGLQVGLPLLAALAAPLLLHAPNGRPAPSSLSSPSPPSSLVPLPSSPPHLLTSSSPPRPASPTPSPAQTPLVLSSERADSIGTTQRVPGRATPTLALTASPSCSYHPPSRPSASSSPSISTSQPWPLARPRDVNLPLCIRTAAVLLPPRWLTCWPRSSLPPNPGSPSLLACVPLELRLPRSSVTPHQFARSPFFAPVLHCIVLRFRFRASCFRFS